MWTPTTRKPTIRKTSRYKTDMTDKEWRVIEPHLPAPENAMRQALIIAALMVAIAGPALGQQGSEYPTPGSSRGAAFPKHVSPTGSNPTNWHKRKHQYTDPYGPNSKRYGWQGERWHR